LPTVQSAAVIDAIPITDYHFAYHAVFRIENRPPVPRGREPQTGGITVTSDFFRTLAVPLFKGRLLDSRDGVGTPRVIVVNEAFARRYFPNEDPIGRRVSMGITGEPVWQTIVGVIGNIHQSGMDRDVEPTIYRSFLQQQDPFSTRMNIIFRASSDPAPLVPQVERIVAAIDRDQPIFDVKTMDQRLADSLGSRRFNAALIGCFAALAVVLAAIGVYGVMSYLVLLRTQEMGIRMALGAQPRQVLGLILREGFMLAVLGSIVGLAGALSLSRFLATLLFGVTTADPVIFSALTLLLLGVVFAACYIPGRRASHVDPLTALRHE